jgi:hypothetical protein
MPLKVVGAACPRTGTLSLKLALEQLGFGPCHHMIEVIRHPELGAPWIDAAEGRPDWDGIFRNYAACVDAPSCYYWRPIAAHYPDAKVILAERDPETWFESIHATVFSKVWIDTTLNMPLGPFFAKLYEPYGDRILDHDYMIADYARYREEVKRTIAPERLLVYRTGDGWEPLCDFLGVPAPDSAFPQSNTREEMLAMISEVRRQADGKGAVDWEDITHRTHGGAISG